MTEGHNFQTAWLDACPTGVLVVDAEEQILWINTSLREMLELGDLPLIGSAKALLPEAAYQVLFAGDSLLHLRSDTGGERWLRCDIHQAEDEQQRTVNIHYYQDVSEQMAAQLACDSLRQRVDDLTLTDELTGLANKRALIHSLVSQVTRSRRYANPLSLMMVRIDSGVTLSDQAMLAISHSLRERLRWADFIGRYEDNLFMLILPETNHEALLVLRDKIMQEVPKSVPDGDFSVVLGLAEWQKGYDPRRLIDKALQELVQDDATQES
ncbi:MAG: diguanylate cyclase [Candidatus Polarisedimenticolaceae bacterium]|nr:diguanylate cyclase [Candidatus Polarisedimenticolaceae bacterium]